MALIYVSNIFDHYHLEHLLHQASHIHNACSLCLSSSRDRQAISAGHYSMQYFGATIPDNTF